LRRRATGYFLNRKLLYRGSLACGLVAARGLAAYCAASGKWRGNSDISLLWNREGRGGIVWRRPPGRQTEGCVLSEYS